MESVIDFKCEYCNRSFPRRFNLNRHVQKVHNRFVESSDNPSENDTVSIEESSHAEESSQSDTDVSSKDSTTSQMKDREWNTYTLQLEGLMRECFDEEVEELTSEDNKDEEDEQDTDELTQEQYELVMKRAKNVFREKLKHYLNIVFGMQDDETYSYLFDKYHKYIGKDIDTPTAISMAVNSSAEIIDKDFEEVINDYTEDSSDGDEQTEQEMDDE